MTFEARRGKAPLLTIFGGDVTTSRLRAERAVSKLTPFYPMSPRWTAKAPLPGGDFAWARFDTEVDRARERWPFLGEAEAQRLVGAYGTRLAAVLGEARERADLGPAFGPRTDGRRGALSHDERMGALSGRHSVAALQARPDHDRRRIARRWRRLWRRRRQVAPTILGLRTAARLSRGRSTASVLATIGLARKMAEEHPQGEPQAEAAIDMPLLRIDAVVKKFGNFRGGGPAVARHPGRRVLCPAGSERLRQDHAVADARRIRDAGRGPHPARRQGYRAGAAAPAPGQHDVPELRAVPASFRARQHRLRPEARGHGARGDRRPRGGDGGAGQARGTGEAQARPALRRPEAARGAGALAGAPAAGCCCSTSRSPRSTRSCARAPSSN